MYSGIPTNIYRDGNPHDPGFPHPYVKAIVHGAVVEARYLGEPPCPLVPAWFFEEQAQWWCLGSEADVRPVLREHFLTVPTTTADGVVACDTSWTLDVTGANSQIAALASSGLGVARLTAGDANGRSAAIFKSTSALLPSSADGFWIRSRVQLGSVANITAIVGLHDLAGSDFAYATFVSSGSANWQFFSSKDTSSTSGATATAGAASTYVWLDMLLCTSVFFALWVNGDGPYFSTTNVPAAADSMTPFIQVSSGTTATKTFDADHYFLDAVDGTVVHPTDPVLKP